jgi:hypothetical protein
LQSTLCLYWASLGPSQKLARTMNAVFDALLKNLRRITILWLSALIGLNVVVAASYFSSRVISNIDKPLFDLPSSKLAITFGQALFIPLIALVASIIGYYFGSKSTKGVHGFGDEGAAQSTWTEVKRTLRKPVSAAIIFGLYAVMAAFMIALNFGLELLLKKLWAEQPLQLFGKFPLSFVFQAADVAIVLVVLIFGALETTRAMSDR